MSLGAGAKDTQAALEGENARLREQLAAQREQLAESESLAASYSQQAQEAEEKAVYWENRAITGNEALKRELQIVLDAGKDMQIGWERDRQRLTESEEDKKRLQFENGCLLADQTRANAAIKQLQDQLNSTRSQLEDQATKACEWYDKAKETENLAEQRWLEIERLQQRQSPLSSPSIPQSELLDNTPESQVGESEPVVVVAIATEESPHLTREQLGKRFGKTREAVRQWEQTGKLTQMGWEPVPGTGSNPKNPRLYRTRSTSATK